MQIIFFSKQWNIGGVFIEVFTNNCCRIEISLRDWIILTFETATKDELTPVERYGEIYPVYFDGEPEQVDGNLLRYKFKEASPYADLTLFVATVDGQHIVHRCDRKPSVLGPILCERTLSLPGDMRLRMRFARSHLEDWAQIERNVRLALANMFRTIQPG